MKARNAALAAIVVLVAACSSSTAPASPSAGGTWIGTANETDGELTITLTLTDKSGAVNGYGTVALKASGVTETVDVDVSGTRTDANVSFSITYQGTTEMSFTGAVAGKNITGTLTGNNGVSLPFQFHKE